ncbi:MAG: tetratricopeptide repeat protein [Myxococcota bacterium]
MTDQNNIISSEEEDARVASLQARFTQALQARRDGDVDSAAELLRGILKVEPRLAEPRMELSHLLLSTGQTDEAEEHAREAIRILETGGQWTDDIPENVLLALAYDHLGESLRQRADSDEIIFGPPDMLKKLHSEARSIFRKASTLDPDNEHAWYWSFSPSERPNPAEE